MRVWGLALSAVMLAGCLAPWDADVFPQATGNPPHLFVAVVDTGINPWHEAFSLRSEGGPPVPAVRIPATFAETVTRIGPEAWNDLEMDTLYWFEGTRVLAISPYDPDTEANPELHWLMVPNPHRIFDDRDHGTGVASLVARAAPNAWIVMVEAHGPNSPSYLWAAQQPWIDVVTSSIGTLANLPNVNFTTLEDEWASAYLVAARSGKLVFNAGGNDPTPNSLSRSGPPWVISVGGAQGERHGPSPLTSQPVDVVADFFVDGIALNTGGNDTATRGGTSFGTPIVAGAVAEAIYQLRAQLGHQGGIRDGALVSAPGKVLTSADFRWALNMSARYWNTSDYSPNTTLSSDPLAFLYQQMSPTTPSVEGTPVGPWLQMGWGYVDARTTWDVVALLGGQEKASGKPDAQAYMERLAEARAAVWDVRQR